MGLTLFFFELRKVGHCLVLVGDCIPPVYSCRTKEPVQHFREEMKPRCSFHGWFFQDLLEGGPRCPPGSVPDVPSLATASYPVTPHTLPSLLSHVEMPVCWRRGGSI